MDSHDDCEFFQVEFFLYLCCFLVLLVFWYLMPSILYSSVPSRVWQDRGFWSLSPSLGGARPRIRFPTQGCSTRGQISDPGMLDPDSGSRPNFLKCSRGRVCAGRGGRLTSCSCNIRLCAQNDSIAKLHSLAELHSLAKTTNPHLVKYNPLDV